MKDHEEIGPFTPKQIETIYQEIMDSGYYDQSYNAEDWKPEPYRLMANILKEVFFKDTPAPAPKPKMLERFFSEKKSANRAEIPQRAGIPQVVDLGCGVGFLVKFLRQVGIAAKGIEFSDGIYKRIDPNTKEHVRLLGPATFYGESQFQQIKLLVALEVFEHLPLNLLKKNLAKISEELDGHVFLTIPSSGVDPWTGRTGFVETSPNRLEDMRKNALFSYLAMLDGKPGGGHITLASFRWWTDFFLISGFTRVYEFEPSLKNYDNIFAAYRWCPYVLNRLTADTIKHGVGWQLSGDGNAAMLMRGGESQLEFRTAHHAELRLDFEQLDANRNLEGQIFWSITELIFDESTAKIEYHERASGIHKNCERAGSNILTIPVVPSSKNQTAVRAYRVQLFYPETRVLTGSFANQVGGQILTRISLKQLN
jgi:SAM-dependent methyltransferase